MRLDLDSGLVWGIGITVWVLGIYFQQFSNMRRIKKLEQKVERWMESEIDKAKAQQKKDESL